MSEHIGKLVNSCVFKSLQLFYKKRTVSVLPTIKFTIYYKFHRLYSNKFSNNFKNSKNLRGYQKCTVASLNSTINYCIKIKKYSIKINYR